MKTVAKGILKDHLVLVANSMTCTGNLNGFNNAGYKATFRSLKVQVPFTESTLFVSLFLRSFDLFFYHNMHYADVLVFFCRPL
jgi:hypothetical protein